MNFRHVSQTFTTSVTYNFNVEVSDDNNINGLVIWDDQKKDVYTDMASKMMHMS